MSSPSAAMSAEQKRALLRSLLQRKDPHPANGGPLSSGQNALWFVHQLDRSSPAYNIFYAATVRPDADFTSLRRSLDRLIDRHTALRTTFGMHAGTPFARFREGVSFPWELVDAAGWSDVELDHRMQTEANRPFDLEQGPVIRSHLFCRGELPHVLMITASHIAVDFWSIDLLIEQLSALYREQMTGRHVLHASPRHTYQDFVLASQQMLQGPQGESLWDYWRESLRNLGDPLDLPSDRPRPPVQTYRGASHRFDVPAELTGRLQSLAKEAGATLYMTMLAAFQVLLFRWSGQDEFIVGSTTSGRNRAEWEDIVGYFLNVIPLRCQLTREMSFRQHLARVRQAVLLGLEHQDFPFPLLVERLAPQRDASRSPIVQVAFNWDRPRKLTTLGPPALSGIDAGDLGLRPFSIAQQGAAFDLTLVFFHLGTMLAGAFQFNRDLLDAATMERVAGYLLTLLEGIAANPEAKLVDLPMMTTVERNRMVHGWNQTSSDFDSSACLHDLVSRQAAITPDRAAVSMGKQRLTYGDLEARSNQLARFLRRRGVSSEHLVGVCLERSPDMLVGILGILKAGGAYVPIDPTIPPERLAHVLAAIHHAGPAWLLVDMATARPITNSIADGTAASSPSFPSPQQIHLDVDGPQIAGESTHTVDPVVGADNLAYVLFTSGSTGRPKGVAVEHRSVVNLLTAMQCRPGITGTDRLLAVTTLTFDISVLELFLPLTVGGEVIIAPPRIAMDGLALVHLMHETRPTIMQATPATWRLVLQAGWQGDPLLKVLCGGESLTADLAAPLRRRCGSLWNMYGPTETTIWSAVDQVTVDRDWVGIGPPIANTQLYVLDERRQPTPIGVPGEIAIGGTGLARGYLNQPDWTAQQFIADPFHPGQQRRIYLTGDRARFRADGTIEFLGRVDHQVKIRGFRMELEEIEVALSQHPSVQCAAVVARKLDRGGPDSQLVAYLVASGSASVHTGEMRPFLKPKLPEYMIPAHYVWLDELPLLASGKVDRKSLPMPDEPHADRDRDYVAPRNDLEQRIARVWSQALGRDRLSVHDNYFDLGGASMQSLQICSLAAAEQIEIPPSLLFQYPTIAELASVIAPRQESRNRECPHVPGVDHPSATLHEAHVTVGKAFAPAISCQVDHVSARRPDLPRRNSVIESIGVYLPPREVSTEEVVRGCHHPLQFPLEETTGIRTRRMSEDGDYSIDLARKAVDECLAYSRYRPGDIDLLICCNITRANHPREVSIEPNTSLQLKRIFGFDQATAFDITNACGGMFTAIHVADAALKSGSARRALIVSGEYISLITRTAQLEITEFLDPRIACLTVGDAGAAVLLELAADPGVGFHELELYTVSSYNRMCIAGSTDQPHGGPIMRVPDPIQHTSVAAEQSMMHARHIFSRSPWSPETMNHLIIHQTSRRSLRDGMRAINEALGANISHDGNTIDNLARRGNTATTTHVVALWDHILSGRIQSGDRTVFAISGSGQTVGTGLYTLDDLPDRLRQFKSCGIRPAPLEPPPVSVPRSHASVVITSIGTSRAADGIPATTTDLAVAAAESCLHPWGRDRCDIDLLLFAGLTRSDFISEPAIATFIAGELKINDRVTSPLDRKTLAFDVFNASLAFLNACEVAVRMIQAGSCRIAMVVTSEVDVNAMHRPDHPLRLLQAGSAVILEASPVNRQGFGSFVFQYATEFQQARTITGHYGQGRPYYQLDVEPELDERLLGLVPRAVRQLLARDSLTLDQVKYVLPSQCSPEFARRLARSLDISPDRLVDLTCDQTDRNGESAAGGDYYTNSLPFGLQRLRAAREIHAGDVSLMIQVSSGIQVGCATYFH